MNIWMMQYCEITGHYSHHLGKFTPVKYKTQTVSSIDSTPSIPLPTNSFLDKKKMMQLNIKAMILYCVPLSFFHCPVFQQVARSNTNNLFFFILYLTDSTKQDKYNFGDDFFELTIYRSRVSVWYVKFWFTITFYESQNKWDLIT